MNGDKKSLSIPVAIIVAGALVAFGIYMSGKGTTTAKPSIADQINNPAENLDTIKPIQPTDHVLGNPKSPIVIVEYSDTECPFCKQFHTTLHDLMLAYPNKIAWVFRYFPVHKKSVNEATAQECVASLGGNDAFWKFTDSVFAATNSNDSLDPAMLPQLAAQAGVDTNAFNTCMSANATKYAAQINQDL